MSFTSKTEQRIIDCQTFIPNSKAVFKLDAGKVYGTDMRLCNIGTYNATQRYYPANVGAMENVRKMMLKDGNTTLCALDKTNFYAGYLHTHKDNVKAEAANVLNRSSLGFKFSGLNCSVASHEDKTRIDLAKFASESAPTTDDDTRYGWVFLREILPMLEATQFVSTDMFKNLTLEIEFEQAVAGNVTPRPFLVVNEIVDEQVAQQARASLGDIAWTEIERDLVRVEEPTTGAAATGQRVTQSLELELKGFRGKAVNRMVLIKEGASPKAGVESDFAKFASPAQLNESINIVLNDGLLLEDAYNRPNKSLARSSDVSGSQCLPTGLLYLDTVDGTRPAVSNDAIDMVGQMDYKSFNIKDRVNSLRLQYSRLAAYNSVGGTEDKTYKQALNIHCYAEVAKMLKVQKDGSYLMAYA